LSLLSEFLTCTLLFELNLEQVFAKLVNLCVGDEHKQ
jgi:hypothetical protein